MSDDSPDYGKAAIPHRERTVLAVLHPCRRQWAELETTDQADVRFCFDCCQPVVHVRTTEDVMQAAALRQCIYIEQHETRGPYLGGMPIIESGPARGPLVWED